jgi:sigma-B regulation protein RsbU (phosphoserine phosphatase)
MKTSENSISIPSRLRIINIVYIVPVLAFLFYVLFEFDEEQNDVFGLGICFVIMLASMLVAVINTKKIKSDLNIKDSLDQPADKRLFPEINNINGSSSADLVRSLIKSNEAYKIRNELERAANYVISLLPKPVCDDTFKTEWRLIPSIELGGDSFGYHWLDSDHFAIYLLDVSHHGVGPALLSVSVLNVLKTQSLPGCDFHDPSSVLGSLNATFQMCDQDDHFFTCWYGVFDKNTRNLEYASAGHPPAILISSCGDAKELITPNFIIGGTPGLCYTKDSVTIEPKNDLYIFSDGVYEIHKPDGNFWTFAELKEYLCKNNKSHESEIDSLYQHLLKLSDKTNLDDDFTMLKVSWG